MLLREYKEKNGWVLSRWELTYNTGWNNILKGVTKMYNFYDNPEILCDKKQVNVENVNSISKIKESSYLVLRGISNILKVPISITFYNQLKVIEVSVSMDSDKFKEINYEKLNKSLCQYMDSIEINMFGK